MRHITLFTFTLVLALSGFSATAFWLTRLRIAPAPEKKEEMVLKQEVIKQSDVLEFNEVSNKKGNTREGVPFSARLFQSSDGIDVSVWRENHNSAPRANKELRRKLKRAATIIERGPKLGQKGQRIGERVIVTFAPAGSQKEHSSVLWTNGSQLYYVESPSLKHALEVEKKFYSETQL